MLNAKKLVTSMVDNAVYENNSAAYRGVFRSLAMLKQPISLRCPFHMT
jgi:hypothetical protein